VSAPAKRVLATVTVLAALAASLAVPASAQSATVGQVSAGPAIDSSTGLPIPDELTPRLYRPSSQTVPPPQFRTTAAQAIAIGERTRAVKEARAKHPGMKPTAYVSPLRLPQGALWHWDVIWRVGDKNIVEVELSSTGQVYVITKGIDIGWPLLLGEKGVIGRQLNAPYVWLPLCLIFLLPFVDPRRPLRLLHLDLAALLGFGISQFFFTRGEPDISVPLVYPFLLYFVARAAWAGFRPAQRRGPLMPYVSTRFLAGGVVLLVALRIAFGVFGSQSFDIGTAGAIGADRIEHGLTLYVDNDAHGDTYGPVNYLMYVPAELAFPFSPQHVAAPKVATLSFDVLILIGLFLLGRGLRPGAQGRRLGAGLAWAWAAFPYSALILAADTNDMLVPLFLIYALVFLRSPPARGALAALGTMAKFAPGLVAPVLLVGRGPFRRREVLPAAAVYVAICIGLIVLFLPSGGVREFWNTTLGFQLGRSSPLSIWDRSPGLDWLKPVFIALAAGLAVVAAFLPRRRSVGQIAALCAAILAAAQIPGSYWLYFYVAWFAPLLFVALFEEYRELGPAIAGSAERDERLRESSDDLAAGVGHDHQVLDAHA
jgi:hypothetical protein